MTGNTLVADTRFTGLQATVAPDADHLVLPAGSTVEANVSNSTVSRFNLAMIDRAVERAKLSKNALRPVKVGGKDFWVMILHPTQVTSMRTNANVGQWTDIQKAAMTGGSVDNNPIFTGALGVYNGVILFESVRIPAVANANAFRAALLGAQGAVMAFGRESGKNVYNWEEELFDYGNQLGVAAGCVAGLVKTRFNGSDFGSFAVTSWEQAS